jgi:predicted ester cyclase
MSIPTVTSVPGQDISDLMNPIGPRRHPMRGFDDEFIDLPDYIVRITYRIWEQRNVHRIYDYYGTDCPMHGSRGTTVGVDSVVSGTVATLACYPDRRLLAEDVIWGGDENKGYYSSHRICNTGTNMGATFYGPATAKKLRWRGVADCLCLENRIIEEWLVRDELAILNQLGYDPQPIVRRIAEGMPARFADEARALVEANPFGAAREMQPVPGDIESFVRSAYHNLWNARKLSEAHRSWVYNHVSQTAGNREQFGTDDLMQSTSDWLTAFPDGVFHIDHFCAVPNPGGGWRTAIRWRFAGHHRGTGAYGAPTGKAVLVPGMTHDTIINGRIVHSWVIHDELALIAQVL